MNKVLMAVLVVFLSQAVYAGETKTATGDSLHEVAWYTYEIIGSYRHDPDAFTQGLAIENGILYEGTGRYGKSSLRRVDLLTGEVAQLHRLPASLFGEGITVIGNRIVQLTWKSKFGLVYDRETFKLLEVFRYQGEGWGITHDGDSLIMSDGTETLRFLNPETFEEKRRIKVTDGQGPLMSLNELEYVEGTIFANVWKTDRIAIIDPDTGRVTGWLDLAGIKPNDQKTGRGEDVLNGIAYDAKSKALYVTGKLWSKLFQIELVQQTEK